MHLLMLHCKYRVADIQAEGGSGISNFITEGPGSELKARILRLFAMNNRAKLTYWSTY